MYKPMLGSLLQNSESICNVQTRKEACYFLRLYGSKAIDINIKELLELATKKYNASKSEFLPVIKAHRESAKELNQLMNINCITEESNAELKLRVITKFVQKKENELMFLMNNYVMEHADTYKVAILSCNSYEMLITLVRNFQSGLCDLLNHEITEIKKDIDKTNARNKQKAPKKAVAVTA